MKHCSKGSIILLGAEIDSGENSWEIAFGASDHPYVLSRLTVFNSFILDFDRGSVSVIFNTKIHILCMEYLRLGVSEQMLTLYLLQKILVK